MKGGLDFLVCLVEFLLYCIYLLGLSVLRGIPALGAHLGVYLILHGDGIVQRLSKCGVYCGGGGLDRPVHKEIAFSFEVKEQIFHYFLFVHG